jgi:hypothetical protein
MNAEVEIHIGQAQNVVAVPNAALRTPKDVSSAAQVLGLSPDQVQQQLAAETPAAPSGDSIQRSTLGATAGPARDSTAAAKVNTMTTPDGRVIPLPAGVTEPQVRAIFAKFRNGETPTPAERAILQKVRQAGGGRQGGSTSQLNGSNYLFGGDYIVFTIRNGAITPKRVRTGITDLDFSEIKSGLAAGDSVLVLPSTSLIQSQQEFKNRFNRMTGGGALPGVRSQTSTPSTSAQPSRPSSPRP